MIVIDLEVILEVKNRELYSVAIHYIFLTNYYLDMCLITNYVRISEGIEEFYDSTSSYSHCSR